MQQIGLSPASGNHGSYRMDYRLKSLFAGSGYVDRIHPLPSCTGIAGHIRVAPHDCNIVAHRGKARIEMLAVGLHSAHHSWYASRAGYEYFHGIMCKYGQNFSRRSP